MPNILQAREHPAPNQLWCNLICESGGIGRRARLRSVCLRRGGSSPPSRTILGLSPTHPSRQAGTPPVILLLIPSRYERSLLLEDLSRKIGERLRCPGNRSGA